MAYANETETLRWGAYNKNENKFNNLLEFCSDDLYTRRKREPQPNFNKHPDRSLEKLFNTTSANDVTNPESQIHELEYSQTYDDAKKQLNIVANFHLDSRVSNLAGIVGFRLLNSLSERKKEQQKFSNAVNFWSEKIRSPENTSLLSSYPYLRLLIECLIYNDEMSRTEPLTQEITNKIQILRETKGVEICYWDASPSPPKGHLKGTHTQLVTHHSRSYVDGQSTKKYTETNYKTMVTLLWPTSGCMLFVTIETKSGRMSYLLASNIHTSNDILNVKEPGRHDIQDLHCFSVPDDIKLPMGFTRLESLIKICYEKIIPEFTKILIGLENLASMTTALTKGMSQNLKKFAPEIPFELGDFSRIYTSPLPVYTAEAAPILKSVLPPNILQNAFS